MGSTKRKSQLVSLHNFKYQMIIKFLRIVLYNGIFFFKKNLKFILILIILSL